MNVDQLSPSRELTMKVQNATRGHPHFKYRAQQGSHIKGQPSSERQRMTGKFEWACRYTLGLLAAGGAMDVLCSAGRGRLTPAFGKGLLRQLGAFSLSPSWVAPSAVLLSGALSPDLRCCSLFMNPNSFGTVEGRFSTRGMPYWPTLDRIFLFSGVALNGTTGSARLAVASDVLREKLARDSVPSVKGFGTVRPAEGRFGCGLS
mmetsp:Transcript_62542/g.103111  ORF Transcript_62542/g.103111 Transcript_62542/m.103111 type:complete len:204 (+) Transcript_62542:596-1207(+)